MFHSQSLVFIRISDIKKPFNEQPRIKIQGKSNQNAAYEKNFPYTRLLGTGISGDSKKINEISTSDWSYVIDVNLL